MTIERPDDIGHRFNRNQWRALERWLLAALDYPKSKREAFIEEHCPTDLRGEVKRLASAMEDSSSEGGVLKPQRIQGLLLKALGGVDPGELSTVSTSQQQSIGPYQLHEELGRGGMGVVYRVSDTRRPSAPDRALKILRSDLNDPESVLRFRRERVMLAAVRSDHVPSLLDSGTTSDGRPYYVMERVSGIPLNRFMYEENPSADIRQAILASLCEAVDQVHESMIIHRDLKPSNIFVRMSDDSQSVCLLDFGIATLSSEQITSKSGTHMRSDGPMQALSALNLTGDRTAPHTPKYAAPEQLRGEEATYASDVYAVGVLVGELVPDELKPSLSSALEQATDPDPSTRMKRIGPLREAIASAR